MPNRAQGLRAIALSTLVAIAGTTAIVAPVAATDPAPVESLAPSPTPDFTAVPSESPAALPVESPAPTLDPSPSASADPASAAPSADSAPTLDPSASASADPASAAPSADPAPSASSDLAGVAAPAAVVPNLGLRVVRIALAQRGDQYRAGGQGPSYFDCSGLVRYAYRKAGVTAKLGGGSSARGMLYWGRLHGLTSSHNPQLGDVAIYGNGTHAGVWIGNGRVVQALNPRLDIRILGLHAVTKPFTTFIHTRIPRG